MAVRWVPALLVAALWWWAVLRLVLVPGHTGLVEGAVVAGGWGLSLLPVHVASVSSAPPGTGRATRASRRRRSDGGSGPS
ncbi:hypothetical protein ABZ726_04075 [Streptomyces hundungensis]|uniref:hypothetical protein n=1 Tax=Streptomyces hundungensis TaxID=1077946 RepID=UPI000EAA2AE8|nr:hypothetical protein [Streptomyces hundungensis]